MKKILERLLTKNGNRIPIYAVYFNINEYRKGKPNFHANFHPNVAKLSDEHKDELQKHMKAVADIIRNNLDMEEML